jgi:uncharacterized Zn finger protein (UPF0148 family)
MCEKVLETIYARDCDCRYYGEAEANAEGKVFCPNCELEWDINSAYTEAIQVWRKK